MHEKKEEELEAMYDLLGEFKYEAQSTADVLRVFERATKLGKVSSTSSLTDQQRKRVQLSEHHAEIVKNFDSLISKALEAGYIEKI